MSRLDKFIAINYKLSRDAAIELIKNNGVTVNGQINNKCSYKVNEENEISINEKLICPYVSRAGLKLEHAIEAFNIDIAGKNCLDVGSSTGGFTDCLIKNGAKKVTCIDVGTNQLHPKLRKNPHVELHEQTDIRKYAEQNLDSTFDIITVDVSFISLYKVLPAISKLATPETQIITLYKPQFEKNISISENNKKFSESGFKLLAYEQCRVTGKEGTIETICKIELHYE